MSLERIQKILSQRGILSRRKVETYIKKGWIRVNGNTISDLGTRIHPEKDHIEFSKDAQKEMMDTTTIAFYKPRGVWSNNPQNNEKQCLDFLPKHLQTLHTIGRLDKDSEGLLLLTNNGSIANYFLNSGIPHARTYYVKTRLPLSHSQLTTLRQGVVIYDALKTQPCTIKRISPNTYIMTLHEGKNRQIRRMIETQNTYVIRLKRLSFGPYSLEDLTPGEWRILDTSKLRK
jgi:pseudouridine synthase